MNGFANCSAGSLVSFVPQLSDAHILAVQKENVIHQTRRPLPFLRGPVLMSVVITFSGGLGSAWTLTGLTPCRSCFQCVYVIIDVCNLVLSYFPKPNLISFQTLRCRLAPHSNLRASLISREIRKALNYLKVSDKLFSEIG